MKTTLSKIAAALVALAFVIPNAVAEPGDGKGPDKGPRAGGPGGPGKPGGPRGPRRGPDGERFKEILEKYDENGNGKLDIDERVVMIQARLAEGGEHAERMKKHFDANEDGEVTDEEIKTAMEKRRERGGRGPGGPRPGGERKRPGGGEKGEDAEL